jgi:phosphopantothenoylcysteine synthetase/decarboxylase
MSAGKNIVLGVTGSIAAHKAVDLASQLTKDGFSVHVAMTADAQKFITPLPFKTRRKAGSPRTLNSRTTPTCS